MTSFLIGKVIDPELREVKVKDREATVFTFGLLSGRVSNVFSVWDEDKIFDDVSRLNDGDSVCAIVSDGLDSRGKVKYYLRRITLCEETLRGQLMSLFAG